MLRQDQYALISMDGEDTIKRYPTDTAEHVIESYIDFASDETLTREERVTAGHFLKQASMLFGMSLPLEESGLDLKNNVVHVKPPVEKKASRPEVFALRGRYPIDTPELIKQASDYMDSHWREFDLRSRREYACNVQKRANVLGCDTGCMVMKFASNHYNPNLKHELNKRAHLAQDDTFEKLGSYIGQIGVDEFASILEVMDARAKIESSYNKSILDPLASVVGIPKQAAIVGKTWDIDGISYSEENMRKGLSHPDVISLYGSSLISRLRNSEVFDELPISDKKVILQYGSV